MGMAASQVRLLQLTGRKNDIGRQLSSLSLQKMSLTREMNKVSKNYQNALNTKIFKWSNNSGVSYVDLSYATLMRPSDANQNTPYLLTNSSGRVVVDSQYQKYAEMISAEGKAGGDYESNRTSILSELTGISAEKIEGAQTTSANVETSAENVNTLQEEVDELEAACTEEYSDTDFIKECFGSVSGFNYSSTETGESNIYDDFIDDLDDQSVQWRLSTNSADSKTRLQELLDQITTNVSQYLKDDDLQAFNEAADATYQIYSDYIDAAGVDCAHTCPLSIEQTNNSGNYCIGVNDFIECLLEQYRSAGGHCEQSSVSTDTYYYETVDRESEAYQAYEAKYAELQAAKSEYSSSVDTDNQSLTSAEESAIAFYDQLFTAIAEKGWVYNADVSDTDYLNQMLQNNQYYITTMESSTDKDGEEYYEYSSSIASNFNKIYSVNDSSAQNKALAEYEYEKGIIDEKESRIDLKMEDLKTEQSSINEMIKSIESVRDDNIERSFSIFT